MSEPTQAHIDRAHAIFIIWLNDNSGGSLEQRDRMIRMIAGALADVAAERSLAPATPTDENLLHKIKLIRTCFPDKIWIGEDGEWRDEEPDEEGHNFEQVDFRQLEAALAPPATQTGDVRKRTRDLSGIAFIKYEHLSSGTVMCSPDVYESIKTLVASSAAPTPEPTGANGKVSES